MKKIVIIGASGHGRVVADIARLNGYDRIAFLDDDETLVSCGEYPVLGRTDSEIDADVIVAIGNAQLRKKFCEQQKDRLVTLIHPAAVVASDVQLGAGTVVMAGAVINPGTQTGRGCIINTSSSVDHDNRIGDYVHVSVGAHLAGTVHVGAMTWIGAGAVVSNNLTICESCTIGAGAVVVKDISEEGVYVGIPARLMKKGDIG